MKKKMSKDKQKVEKADCGHYELAHIIVRQLGKINCRNCARKINAQLSRLVGAALRDVNEEKRKEKE